MLRDLFESSVIFGVEIPGWCCVGIEKKPVFWVLENPGIVRYWVFPELGF